VGLGAEPPQLAGHQLEIEAREIDEIPDGEREELALIYEVSRADASACWISSRKAGANSHAGRASDRPCVPRR
jgi:hypothetical protein